jgi:hypothetical protein
MSKKTALLLFAAALFALVPFRLEAGRLALKVSYGMTPAGKTSDAWQSTTNYYGMTTAAGKSGIGGLDLAAQLEYRILPNVGVYFGLGIISKSVYGNVGQFTVPGEAAGIYNSYSPLFTFMSYPFSLGLNLTVPIRDDIRLTLSGGMEYHLAKIDTQDSNYEVHPTGAQTDWSYFMSEYASRTQALGQHIAFAVDWEASEDASFFAEVVYRNVKFTKFNTYSLYSADVVAGLEGISGTNTFLYARGIYTDAVRGDVVYRMSALDYSGLIFRIGINIRIADLD